MRDVYRLAETVLVWLGPHASKKVEAASGTLQSLAQAAKGLIHPQPGDSEVGSFESYANEVLPPNSEASTAFSDSSNQSYWTRLWIVQEIHSAK
jgi:hypothetical protein